MDESVLWAVALGAGALGLLLLTVAGAAAMYLNTRTRARRARDTASVGRSQARAGDLAAADESQARAGDVASADEPQSRAGSSAARRTTAGGFWAWVKAWVFALVHAGTVSMVLGGITFWEDIAKASDESSVPRATIRVMLVIGRTGGVS